MTLRENETTELKAIVTDDLKKEIIAFANSHGGKIYIGVQDDGTVLGVADPDGTALQISNMIRDAIKPDLTMFIHYETIKMEKNRSFLLISNRELSVLIISPKKGCVRKEFTFVRDTPLHRLPALRSGT
ncbi:MAG: ATP-binding protein [Lachnospiraceae bacterium]|nr:ATP-binding protein [Lachnospiraceae bacterium]